MADTLAVDLVFTALDLGNSLWGPYWSDASTGVIVYMDNGADLSFERTTDKGAAWTKTEIQAGNGEHIAVWYDKETPGDTGTLLHIAWLDNVDAAGSEDARYVTVDVADGSVGTIRTVDGTLTVSGFSQENRIAITKTVNGNIIVAFETQTEIACYKSADNFATAGTSIADVYETAAQEDWCLLFPADVDAGDACALFMDRDGGAITLKMYDDSADSWTETAIVSISPDQLYIGMDGAIRHSDKHLLAVFHNNNDTTTDDLKAYDLTVNSIASPTVTAKTDVFTNQAESAQAAIFINQQNDDVYVTYLKGGTWEATVDVVYHKSTDGMGTWDAESAYSESAADDFRLVSSGRSVGDSGGRFQPAFFDDDDVDIYVNEVNDVEIAAVGGVTTRRYSLTLTGVG